MRQICFSFSVLILLSSLSYGQQSDSSSVTVFPRTDVLYDSLTTFSYSKQYAAQNLLYLGAKPREYFVGVNFGFGTLFNANIKSNYPGFIGFGLQSGIKFNTGFILEADWRSNIFQRNVNYNYLVSDGNDSTHYFIQNGSFTVNHLGISLLFTDFRSPFIAFRYFYTGIGAGIAQLKETRTLTIQNAATSNSETSDQIFSEWHPNIFFIFGMNFLYLPQSQNWFSIDFRLDYIFKNTPVNHSSILGFQNQFTGINSTVRFYFDLTR